MGVIEARRRILLSAPHVEATTPAGIANFSTDLIAPLKSLRVGFEPVQEGSGDPSPSNVRPISGWSGVTVYKAGKNLYNSATDTPRAYIRGGNDNIGEVSTTSGNYTATDFIPVIPSAVYTINYNATSTASAAGMAFYGSKSIDSAISGVSLATQTHVNGSTGATRSYYTFTVPNDCHFIRFSTFPESSNIQLELSSTPTSYEPFQGTTIPVTFPAAGKNLLKNTAETKESKGITFAVNSDGSVTVSGTNDGTGYSNIVVNNSFDMANGVSYILNGGYSSDVFIRDVTAAVSSIGSDTTIVGDGRAHNIEIRVKSGVSISGTVTVKPMIRLSTIADATYAPYSNAFYGGYVDLVRGELTITTGRIYYKWGVFTPYPDYSPEGFETRALDLIEGMFKGGDEQTYGYCNVAKMSVRNDYTSQNNHFFLSRMGNKLIVVLAENSYGDDDHIEAYVELATPITLPLTPQVIKSLRGVNNVWSDANGNVAVEFWKH